MIRTAPETAHEIMMRNAGSFSSPPVVSEMVAQSRASCNAMRAEINNVRYGAPGQILFDFRGVVYQAPEPHDVMPVGSGEASKAWALTMLLSDKATPVK